MIVAKKQFTFHLMILFLFLTAPTEFSYGQDLDLGTVDSFYYLTDSIGEPITQLDTAYYPDGHIAQVGRLILKKDSSKSDLRYGVWVEYKQNGGVRSQGNYAVGGRWFCSSRQVWRYYNYKVGEWTYDNDFFSAQGAYIVKTKKVGAGGCDTNALCSFINKSWVIKNDKGEKIRATRKIKRELNWIGY